MKSSYPNRRRLMAGACSRALLSLKRAGAFPPAPHHLLRSMGRDEYGNPLNTDQAEVVLETASSVQVTTRVVPGHDAGANYRLAVPMDAGLTGDLYKLMAE